MRARERADHRGLREAGHAFEQAMAAGEHGDDQLLDDLVLADDELAHLVGDLADRLDEQRGGGFVVERVQRRRRVRMLRRCWVDME